MSNENSMMMYESGVTPFAMGALTDASDHKTFNSSALLFSDSPGNSPVIRPNGVLTGGNVTTASPATNNAVDVAALTCNLAGVETTVAAGLATAIARAATNVASISSVTVTSAGAIAVIKGTDSATTAFSETRGAAGGPPFIPVGSIELAQVRTTSNVAAAIKASEILQVPGTHKERADFPVYDIKYSQGKVVFNSALVLSHTGNLPKAVYASYAEPIFQEQTYGNDFTPAETSNSVSSTQVYGATIGASTSSLSQGSFTAILKDGITDDIITRKGQTLWFKYLQDRTKAPHILTQGKLGLSRVFAASDNPKVTCTISATTESVERSS
jgi:hypothetical protein